LLARNFETIDFKPLFADLDERLTKAIERGGKIGVGARYFRERERLRAMARNLAAREANPLSARPGVRQGLVNIKRPCSGGPVAWDSTEFSGQILRIGRIADGIIEVVLAAPRLLRRRCATRRRRGCEDGEARRHGCFTVGGDMSAG
jgi:hypothetical protein